MFLFWWVGARFVPGGSALSGAMVNCFVHVIMYAYYGVAAMGPKVQQYLWWKKYLTILQLIQFTTGVVLGLNAILTGCQFTRWMQYVFVGYAFSFIILFGKFYRTAYSCKEKESRRSSSSSESSQEFFTFKPSPTSQLLTPTSTITTTPTSATKGGHGRKKRHPQSHHSRKQQQRFKASKSD